MNSEVILCVDDHPGIASLLEDYVRRLVGGPRKALGFSCPLLAWEWFSQNSKDVVLLVLDYKMPGLNGDEFARRASHLRPGLPMLLITAGCALREGTELFDDHLMKPFSAIDFRQAVMDLL